MLYKQARFTNKHYESDTAGAKGEAGFFVEA